MKQKKLSEYDRLEIQRRNLAWTVEKWTKFCRENDFGLVIEDGKVKTFHRQEVEYTV